MSWRTRFGWLGVLLLAMVGGAAATYVFIQHILSAPAPAQTEAQPQARIPAPKAEPPQVLEVQPAQSSLPELSSSDSYVLNAISDLLGNKSLMSLFLTERVIHNIVATIDNLSTNRAPMSVMPVNPASGMFMVIHQDGELFISPRNADRYRPYMRVVEAIDPKKLVALYLRLYPLFQQSYEELGYPNKYFNDRLMEVLEDLLDAPDVRDPIKLTQPHVFYEYADPDLQQFSIGQRILVRIGSKNEAILKAKLLAIKQELALHMRSATGDAK
jgi:Protein of unknown function (DUF3014)